MSWTIWIVFVLLTPRIVNFNINYFNRKSILKTLAIFVTCKCLGFLYYFRLEMTVSYSQSNLHCILGFHMTSQKWRGSTLKQNTVIRVSRLLVLCISLVFGGKYVEFRIIFSLQYSMSINTFEVDPPSDSLHSAVVKPKNFIVWHCISLFGIVF
jgi:hypothetical protein